MVIARAISRFGHPRQGRFECGCLYALCGSAGAGALEHLRQPGADAIECPGQRIAIGDRIDVHDIVRRILPVHVVVMRIIIEAVEAQVLAALAVVVRAEHVQRNTTIVNVIGKIATAMHGLEDVFREAQQTIYQEGRGIQESLKTASDPDALDGLSDSVWGLVARLRKAREESEKFALATTTSAYTDLARKVTGFDRLAETRASVAVGLVPQSVLDEETVQVIEKMRALIQD